MSVETDSFRIVLQNCRPTNAAVVRGVSQISAKEEQRKKTKLGSAKQKGMFKTATEDNKILSGRQSS